MKVLTLEGLAHFHAKLKSTIDNLGKQLPAIDETCITPTPTEDSNSFTLQADLCSTLKERMRTLDVLEIDFEEGWCEAVVIALWSNDQGEGINLIGLDDKGMAWSWRINYTEGTCVRKKLATSEDVESGAGGGTCECRQPHEWAIGSNDNAPEKGFFQIPLDSDLEQIRLSRAGDWIDFQFMDTECYVQIIADNDDCRAGIEVSGEGLYLWYLTEKQGAGFRGNLLSLLVEWMEGTLGSGSGGSSGGSGSTGTLPSTYTFTGTNGEDLISKLKVGDTVILQSDSITARYLGVLSWERASGATAYTYELTVLFQNRSTGTIFSKVLLTQNTQVIVKPGT